MHRPNVSEIDPVVAVLWAEPYFRRSHPGVSAADLPEKATLNTCTMSPNTQQAPSTCTGDVTNPPKPNQHAPAMPPKPPESPPTRNDQKLCPQQGPGWNSLLSNLRILKIKNILIFYHKIQLSFLDSTQRRNPATFTIVSNRNSASILKTTFFRSDGGGDEETIPQLLNRAPFEPWPRSLRVILARPERGGN